VRLELLRRSSTAATTNTTRREQLRDPQAAAPGLAGKKSNVIRVGGGKGTEYFVEAVKRAYGADRS
jgi:hypothetical protein